MDWFNWVIANGNIVDVIIILMGFVVVGYVRMAKKEIKELKGLVKDVTYKYNVLNTWAFFADKTLKLNGLKCGNSQGDVMLDWDSVPTLTDKP